MKRREPARSPKGTPGYLYKSLDELEGVWPDGDHPTPMVERLYALHRKSLMSLSDAEVDLALGQRVGFPWLLVLTLHRLRQDPFCSGEIGRGDLLRHAMELGREAWGALLPELEQIADMAVPTLIESDEDDWLEGWLVEPYRRFKKG